MKPCIVFMALTMLFSVCFAYESDYQKYEREETSLKEAAEEAASMAGLCIDYEKYGDGAIAFERNKAKKEVLLYVEHYLDKICRCEVKSCSVTICGKDDSGQWSEVFAVREKPAAGIGNGGGENTARIGNGGGESAAGGVAAELAGYENPAIGVVIELEVADMFRLDCVEVRNLARIGVYELLTI